MHSPPDSLISQFVILPYSIIEHGVFSTQEIKKGTFIAEYKGRLLSYKEGEKTEERYKKEEKTGKVYGSFLYFFEKYC